MANTLTNLYQVIFAALDTVSRELVGFIPAVQRNSTVERAAIGQTVTWPISPAVTTANNTPAVTPPDTGDQVMDTNTIAITKSKHAAIRWNGEEQKAGVNAGWYAEVLQDQFAQAFRALANLVEADLASLYTKASRAYGNPGTAPFDTAANFMDLANIRKILEDNGAPTNDLHLVLNTAAMANLRGKQSNLFKVNEAGTEQLLRQGVIAMIEGFALHTSAQVAAHTKGTGTLYVVNDATPPGVGDTSIIAGSGSGTILAGDVVVLANSADKYIVNTGISAAGTLVINKNGLRVAADDTDTITVGNSFAANMAFHKNAIHLATRVPARPINGDMAQDVTIVQDPVSGLAFEIAYYPQFRQGSFHVSIAWGYGAIKSENIAILLG